MRRKKNTTGMDFADNGKYVRWPKPKRASFFDFLKMAENDPLFNKFYNSIFVEQPQPQQQAAPVRPKEDDTSKTSSLKQAMNKQIKSGNGYILQTWVVEKNWPKIRFILEDNPELCQWLAKQEFSWIFDLPKDILEIINSQL